MIENDSSNVCEQSAVVALEKKDVEKPKSNEQEQRTQSPQTQIKATASALPTAPETILPTPSSSCGASVATFNCELCHISCSSEDVFETHIKGQKHQKKLKRKQEIEASGEAERILTSELYCKLCAVELTSKDHMILHVAGKRHKQNALKAGEKLEDKPVEEQFPDVTVEWDKYAIPEERKQSLENKYDYFCASCDKYLVGKTQLIMHIRSNKHQTKSGLRVPKPAPYLRFKRKRNSEYDMQGMRNIEEIDDNLKEESRFLNYSRYQTASPGCFLRNDSMSRRKFARPAGYYDTSFLSAANPQSFYGGFNRPAAASSSSFAHNNMRYFNNRYYRHPPPPPPSQNPRNYRSTLNRIQEHGMKINRSFTCDAPYFSSSTTTTENVHTKINSPNNDNAAASGSSTAYVLNRGQQPPSSSSSYFADENKYTGCCSSSSSYAASCVETSAANKNTHGIDPSVSSKYDTGNNNSKYSDKQQSNYEIESGAAKLDQYGNIMQSNFDDDSNVKFDRNYIKQNQYLSSQKYADNTQQKKMFSNYSSEHYLTSGSYELEGASDFYPSNQYSTTYRTAENYSAESSVHPSSHYDDKGYGASSYNYSSATVTGAPSAGQTKDDGTHSTSVCSTPYPSDENSRHQQQRGIYASSASLKKEY